MSDKKNEPRNFAQNVFLRNFPNVEKAQILSMTLSSPKAMGTWGKKKREGGYQEGVNSGKLVVRGDAECIM